MASLTLISVGPGLTVGVVTVGVVTVGGDRVRMGGACSVDDNTFRKSAVPWTDTGTA